MATHRVSARAHPRFDRHTPPCAEDLWQTCSCESSVTGFFNTEVPPSFYPLSFSVRGGRGPIFTNGSHGALGRPGGRGTALLKCHASWK